MESYSDWMGEGGARLRWVGCSSNSGRLTRHNEGKKKKVKNKQKQKNKPVGQAITTELEEINPIICRA